MALYFMRFALFAVFALIGCCSTAALAKDQEAAYAPQWGSVVHPAIAQVAAARLTPAAQKAVARYLGASHTMPSVASIPDTYGHTAQGKWSGPLHYVNLQAGAIAYSPSDCPASGCVVSAIYNYTEIQGRQNTSGPVCSYGSGLEPCALIFLIHFVGDIHQPLHAGWGSDRGGNSVDVDFFGKQTNLHSMWDSAMPQRWASTTAMMAAKIEDYISSNPSKVQEYLANMDPAVWANESFQYVRLDVYDFGDAASLATARKDDVPDISDWYYDKNLPIVQERLAAASVRLAALLNRIF